ncbi:aspartate aminotransferase family protein [Streptomyces turgidiscabies]|uniref:Acetylornithine/succinyldiaminopimelate/putresci ne aminotransferase n=1 Tax=Streptomyces turgidiscabies TaxID=85558 RepID=A0ABU0RLF1_9ACTN|nr:aminotransferase class III-fold pyridoxal phosphate-dependent enzyme [Streptomyces turgidiscabies]MDQ0932817.1 acetylornithine/succinyldiaminopimelate/putrescine aminotransferase [Streptomyces turgidiscabies]
MTDALNSTSGQPQLAEPHLGAVLASAGLDAEYVRAEGNTLYQCGEDGREIPVVDYAGGYGSLMLGHNNPAITAYAKELLEAGIPVHTQFSLHPEAAELALALNRIISRETGDDEPFFAVFANTGAEANEAAVKHAEMDRGIRLGALLESVNSGLAVARDAVLAGSATVPAEVFTRAGLGVRAAADVALDELIDHITAHNTVQAARPPLFLTPEGSFHGKLVSTVQLTHNEGYRVPFQALAARARFVPLDEPGALRKIVDEERATLFGLAVEDGRVRLTEHESPVICAFVLEPIQGEGGIRELLPEFVQEIQEVCAEIGAPVVVDEIQSGMGRTGDFLAGTRLGLRGDYYTLAKSLGGGLAKISVLLVRGSRYQGQFELIHSSTFAKDGFSNRIALKVLELLEADDGAAYRKAAELGDRLLAVLRSVRDDFPDVVKDVRGRGLMLGLEFHDQSGAAVPPIAEAARAGLFGYLIAGHLLRGHRLRTFPTASSPDTLRFEPSVLLSDDDITLLDTALRDTCDIIRDGYRRPLALPAG